MKSAFLTGLGITLLMVITSCTPPLTKDDVLNYNGQIANATALQNAAVASYKAAFNDNFVDNATALGMVKDETLPKFQDLEKELKKIDSGLKFKELKEIHKLWVESAEVTLQGLNDIKGALEKGDLVLLKSASDKVAEAQAKSVDFNKQYLDLCKKFGIPTTE